MFKDIVLAERKFAIYSIYLDTTLGGQTEVQEGETRQEARARLLKELEEDAARLRNEWREATTLDLGYGKGVPSPTVVPYGAQPLGIIDLSDEKIEIAIDNADTPEKLQQVKVEFPVMSVKMIAYWNAKNKTLTNA